MTIHTNKRARLAAAAVAGVVAVSGVGAGTAVAAPDNPQTRTDQGPGTTAEPGRDAKTSPQAGEGAQDAAPTGERQAPSPQSGERQESSPQTGEREESSPQTGEQEPPKSPQAGEPGGESQAPKPSTTPQGGGQDAPAPAAPEQGAPQGGPQGGPQAGTQGESQGPGGEATEGGQAPAPKPTPKSGSQSQPTRLKQGPPFVVADVTVHGLPVLKAPTPKDPSIIGWTDGVPEGPKLPPAPKLPDLGIKLPPPPVVVNIHPVKPGHAPAGKKGSTGSNTGGKAPTVKVRTAPPLPRVR